MLTPITPDTNSGFLLFSGKNYNISQMASSTLHDLGPVYLSSLSLN